MPSQVDIVGAVLCEISEWYKRGTLRKLRDFVFFYLGSKRHWRLPFRIFTPSSEQRCPNSISRRRCPSRSIISTEPWYPYMGSETAPSIELLPLQHIFCYGATCNRDSCSIGSPARYFSLAEVGYNSLLLVEIGHLADLG